MSKMLVSFFLLAAFSLYIFLNLGRFVDVTIPPVKSDIIVALGGDYSGCRLKKALKLYKEGYSKSGKFIYTSRDSVSKSLDKSGSRRKYLLNNGIVNDKIINISREMISNTMEEVFFIKQYMLYHNYTSVLIISHPQHSRRIESLAYLIADYKKDGLVLKVTSCEPTWWNASKYYKNETSFNVTMIEVEKLVYNLMKYSPLLIKYTHFFKSDKSQIWDSIIKDELK